MTEELVEDDIDDEDLLDTDEFGDADFEDEPRPRKAGDTLNTRKPGIPSMFRHSTFEKTKEINVSVSHDAIICCGICRRIRRR